MNAAVLSIRRLLRRGVGIYWRNKRLILRAVYCASGMMIFLVLTFMASKKGLITQLELRNQSPSLAFLFGTDWMGRDMFARVFLGLRLSFCIGLISALISSVIGVLLGVVAATFGGIVEKLVNWLIDVVMSLPHLVFQILIAFAAGGGLIGVIFAISLTHWTTTARVVRAEIVRIRSAEYVKLSEKLGRPKRWIARHHMLPQVLPQFLVALVLMFPHAISHEAALSFIGIGLTPHMPSMGIILAESMRGLSAGYWWLLVFPGIALFLLVQCFDGFGESLRDEFSPKLRERV